jgi:hypothetical protein
MCGAPGDPQVGLLGAKRRVEGIDPRRDAPAFTLRTGCSFNEVR